MKELAALVLIAVLALSAVACSGDSDDARDGTSTPVVTASPTIPPSTPETPSSATPTQSPAPTETPTPPVGDETGIEAVDAVIEAVLGEDAAAFESLLRFTEAACTHAFGSGGPPKCFAYQPAPAEGTVVEAFPLSTCEGGWYSELTFIAEMLFDRELALYGVVRLSRDEPLFGIQYYPQPEYGVRLQHESNGETAGILLGIEDAGGVSFIDFFCFPPPDWMFSEAGQAVYGDVELIYEGPAYTPPTGGTGDVPRGSETGDAGMDAVIEAVVDGDREALEELFELTSTACDNVQGLGGPPRCTDAPGSPPPGTTVEGFPHGFCEGTWSYDVTPIIDGMIEADPELYAVIEHDAPFTVAEGFPTVEHDLVFEYSNQQFESLGMVVGVNQGRIVTQYYTCASPPELRVENLRPDERVILYGPAYP